MPSPYGTALGSLTPPQNELMGRLLGSVTRASPKEEARFFQTHPHYAEQQGGKYYVNESRLRKEGSTGDFLSDMHLGEALHKLDEVAPEWHDRLQKAAAKDPAVQRWKQQAYERVKQKGETRSIDQWWNVSQFDQIVGGFLFGGPNANVHTMRDEGWDRYNPKSGFGTGFRKELERFEKALGRTPPTEQPRPSLRTMPN